ncbi:MAG: serine/threonine protein kinase [Bacteroides sp.]|nr:serine/threonine protein kinase [Bacteroides sp.]
MELQQGNLLQGGKYRIERVLGQGGFGITYLAIQKGLERKVAVKEFFMKEFCDRDETSPTMNVVSKGSRELVDRYRQKFVKEAQTIAKLKHPNVIGIHDIFEENNTAYYVMEYLEGGSLKDIVAREGSMMEAEALKYIRQVAGALAYIHDNKILHLDVKPTNILLENGAAILIDFGISKRYDETGGQTSSTPAGISKGYAPLEQYQLGGMNNFQPCTDIYSLGATLFYLLTGQQPPEASIINEEGLPALPPTLRSSTVAAIEKAMQPRRKDRPQSIRHFLQLLETTTRPADDEATIISEDWHSNKTTADEETIIVDRPKHKESKTDPITPPVNTPTNKLKAFWKETKEVFKRRNFLTNIFLIGALLLLGFITAFFCVGAMFGEDEFLSTFYIFLYAFAGLSLLTFKEAKAGFWMIATSLPAFLIYCCCFDNMRIELVSFFYFSGIGALFILFLFLCIKQNGCSAWKHLKDGKNFMNSKNQLLLAIIISCILLVCSIIYEVARQ